MTKFNRQPLAEHLEPRLLFSADPITALLDGLSESSGDTFSSRDLPSKLVQSSLESVAHAGGVVKDTGSDETERKQLAKAQSFSVEDSADPLADKNRPGNDEPRVLPLDAPIISPSNLVVNGNFDTGDLSGWTTNGTVSYTGGSEMRFGADDETGPHAASQSLATQVGQSYTLTFQYRDDSLADSQAMFVSIVGGSNFVGESFSTTVGGTGFQTHSLDFVADSASTVLSFQDASFSSFAVDGLIDSVQFTANPSFTPITEDDANNSGDSVADLLASVGGDLVTDPDAGAVEGIAVVDASWAFDFSLDGGSSWQRFDYLSPAESLLLRASDLIRFVPSGVSAQQASIEFRAWDQTSGVAGTYVNTVANGGNTAFSADTAVAKISTIGINDAPSFGAIGGFAIGIGFDESESVLALSDGSTLFATYDDSDYHNIAKLNPDGQLDLEFGQDGYFESADFDYINDLQQQADGKFVATGYIEEDLVLARYLADGTLDSGFGSDGVAILSLSAEWEGYGLAIQADGSIVVVGSGNQDSVVARFTSSGVLDTSFDLDGLVTFDFGGSYNAFSTVSILGDGRIVAGGDNHIVRLNSDGSLDTSWDGDGLLDVGHDIYSLVVQTDGAVAATGISGDNMVVSRFATDGSADTGFGSGGTATWSAPNALSSYGNDIVQQLDGKLLVVGTAETVAGYGEEWFVTRLNTDGSLDTSFAGDGTWFSGLNYDYVESSNISLFDDGTQEKIVVGGYNNLFGYERSTIARLNADGSLDTSFSSGQLDGSPTYTENGPAVILDGNVQVFDQELNYNDNFIGASLALSRAGGANSDDEFGASGDLVFNNGDIEFDGLNLGTYTQTGGELVLNFDAYVLADEINGAMQSITYQNASDNPATSVQIDWSFSDGNSGAQGAGGPGVTNGSTVVSIIPLNDPPVALGNSVVVAEDAPTLIGVAPLLFSDAEGDSLDAIVVSNLDLQGGSLTHSGGVVVNDGDRLTTTQLADLTFTNQTGNILSAQFDYTVEDLDPGLISATFLMHVDRPNTAPDITSFGGSASVAVSIAENTESVATVTAADPDVPESITFSVEGVDSAFFSVDAASGELRFAEGANYENPQDNNSDNIYTVDVVATDQLGERDSQTFNISVLDANEAPYGLTLSNNIVYDQTDSSGGHEVGILTARDEDTTDTYTYSIVGGFDQDLFQIGGDHNDRLILKDGLVSADWTWSYEVVVRVTDSSGQSFDKYIEIYILYTNSNESIFVVEENGEDESDFETGNSDSNTTFESESDVDPDEHLPEKSGRAKPAFAQNNTGELIEQEADLPRTITGSIESGSAQSDIETELSVAVARGDAAGDRTENPRSNTTPPPLKQIDLVNLRLENLEEPASAALLRLPLASDSQSVVDDLRRVTEELNAAAEQDVVQQQFIRDIGSGITISLTAGAISWLMKSGSLLASFMSTVPAWRNIDPLPILSANKGLVKGTAVETQEEKRVSDLFG